jgi:hypothetical protein
VVEAREALQPNSLGISSVSRPKRYEVGSLRVDMGSPGQYKDSRSVSICLCGVGFGSTVSLTPFS